MTMRTLPETAHFKLTAPIDLVPAGAIGQLRRLDADHVAMLFSNNKYPDLVFDINDTEPQVRAAISLMANPSMTVPPNQCRQLAIAAVVTVAFLVGWVAHTPVAIQTVRHTAVEYVVSYFTS